MNFPFDFRSITRNSDRTDTHFIASNIAWLRCGEIRIVPGGAGSFTCAAHLGQDATDEEHDSAYAFSFDVVGLEFKSLSYGQTRMECWLHPDSDKFRVDPYYEPFKKGLMCKSKDCEKPHPITSYLPRMEVDARMKLYTKLRSELITIITGTLQNDE